MTAQENLNPRQFRLTHMTVDDDNPMGSHMLMAHRGNQHILGMLSWKNGVVQNVTVQPAWEHQGIATQMWEKANEITPGLRHSDNRTDPGNDWAKKVGGPLPERVQDHPEWYELK